MLGSVAALGLIVFVLCARTYRAVDPVAGPRTSRADRGLRLDVREADRRRVVAILIVTSLAIFFWMGCSVMGSAVVFFMKRHVHWIAAGVSLPPIVFLSFASFAVVVLGPLMARLWSGLAARGLEPTEVQKMAIGLGLLSLSYLLLSSVALDLGPSGLGGPAIHLLCVGFYLLHTGGLVIVVPAGLAFLTRWAPVRWVGPLTGLWFLSGGVGAYAGGLLTDILGVRLEPAQLYAAFCGGLLVVAVVQARMNRAIAGLVSGSREGADELRVQG